MPQSVEVDELFERGGMDDMDYLKRWGIYRVKLSQDEIRKNTDLLRNVFSRAHDQAQ
jgi:hypothetical protein